MLVKAFGEMDVLLSVNPCVKSKHPKYLES